MQVVAYKKREAAVGFELGPSGNQHASSNLYRDVGLSWEVPRAAVQCLRRRWGQCPAPFPCLVQAASPFSCKVTWHVGVQVGGFMYKSSRTFTPL